MVFANPNWFMRRKHGGWGLETKTKKGVIYLLCVLGPFVIFQMLPFWSTETRLIVTGIWFAFLSVEVIDVMGKLKKDEKEILHEAIAERNALWGILVVLVAAMLYQIYQGVILQKILIDWWIVAALFVGAIIKSISNYKLDKKR